MKYKLYFVIKKTKKIQNKLMCQLCKRKPATNYYENIGNVCTDCFNVYLEQLFTEAEKFKAK